MLKYKFAGVLLMNLVLIALWASSWPLAFSAEIQSNWTVMKPEITYQGDVTGDGRISIVDVVMVTGTYGVRQGDPRFLEAADVNDDGVIDLLDLTIVSKDFGKTYYSLLGPPVAYSDRLNFTIPAEEGGGTDTIEYWIQVRVYVPPVFSGKSFHVSRTAGGGVDRYPWPRWTTYVDECEDSDNWFALYEGYHLIRFQCAQYGGLGGFLDFSIATATNECAWMDRFHIDTPNYTDNEIKYTVKTHAYFPGDTFFLGGFADDYIDDIMVDVGLMWQDWMWDMGSYGAIYAWGDGFMYPLDWQYGWHDVTFAFGEIRHAGLLDFQYISWTNQENRFGPPKFYALGGSIPADRVAFDSSVFYGGSHWKDPENPEVSERFFEAREVIDSHYDSEYFWFDASFEIGLRLGWAEWALPPATEDDLGIALNLTCIHMETGGVVAHWFDLILYNATIELCSFSSLEIKGLEYEEHDSFVTNEQIAAIDYAGSVMMFASSVLEQPIGAAVGLGIKGLAAAIKITRGSQVSRFSQIVSEPNRYIVRSNGGFGVSTSPYFPTSCSDVLFLKLDPGSGKHCGLTKVTLRGTLWAAEWSFAVPIADIQISLYVPWFLRG